MATLSPTEIGARILKAAASGERKVLKEIRKKFSKSRDLKQICDVYSDFSTGKRALHHAAETGNLEICGFLIENFGAYVDVPSYCGNTPLIEATKGEHYKVVECLISHETVLELPNNRGFTALHYATLKDNIRLMELLLKNGAPTERDSTDGTPLQIAASHKNLVAMKLLLQYGAEPNSSVSSVPDTPLIWSIKNRSMECFQCLLEAKANPNKFVYGLTPLALAAKEKDTRYLQSLIDAGATADKLSTGNSKAIEFGGMADNVEAVRILFPLTEKIKAYPTWSVDGIMKYNRSGATKAKREVYNVRYLDIVDDLGKAAITNDDYNTAVDWYSVAVHMDPNNPRWLSIRSMCYARVGKGVHALRDAEESIKRNPQRCPCPKPHYTGGDQGVSWQLFKRYHMATTAYILSPDDTEAKDKFRSCLFEYFSWLYLTSCPAEMMFFFQHFM